MATYQLVGYNWDHWTNKYVSRVTRSKINHVSIRVTPCGGAPNELYCSAYPTDTWVPTSVVERLNGQATWISRHYPIDFADLVALKEDARWWRETEPASITHSLYYHYLGRYIGGKVPYTCTYMCSRALNRMGVHVAEEFYPNRLIQDFIMEVY